MTQKTTEKISAIRWLAILVLIALFVGDFGFDVMAKPVPKEAYWVLLAISAGINIIDLRKVLLRVAGVHDKTTQFGPPAPVEQQVAPVPEEVEVPDETGLPPKE